MQAIRKPAAQSSGAASGATASAAASKPATKQGVFDYEQVSARFFDSLFNPASPPVSEDFAGLTGNYDN
jgi:hypothetical protein